MMVYDFNKITVYQQKEDRIAIVYETHPQYEDDEALQKAIRDFQ